MSSKDYGYSYDIATCMYDSVVRKILNECKCEPTFASGINQVKTFFNLKKNLFLQTILFHFLCVCKKINYHWYEFFFSSVKQKITHLVFWNNFDIDILQQRVKPPLTQILLRLYELFCLFCYLYYSQQP